MLIKELYGAKHLPMVDDCNSEKGIEALTVSRLARSFDVPISELHSHPPPLTH